MGQHVQHVVIISGPGGVGKGTIVRALMDRHQSDGQVTLARSATTRPARPGEVDGEHYDFITPERFEELINEDGFLEWATFGDNRYGTPAYIVRDAQTPLVILEIDCQGFDQLHAHPERIGEANLHTIFIAPPSWEALEARLIGRDGADDPRIAKRLEIGRHEMAQRERYDHVVVNDTLETAIDEVDGILMALLAPSAANP